MFALLMKSKPWRFSFSSRILFTSATFLLGVGSFLSFLRNIDEYAICDDGLLSWILFNVFMISSLSASALLLFMSFVPAWTTIMSLSDSGPPRARQGPGATSGCGPLA